MARVRAQTIGGGLGITPTSVSFYDVLGAGGTIAQMAVGGGLTGTWTLVNSSSSLVALSAGGLLTRGVGAAATGAPIVSFTSTDGNTILQIPVVATVIVATLPANTVLPTLSPSGAPVVGVPVTATTGTWTGNPTPTFAYQWRQVDAATNISGATSATYTPVAGDVGHTLTCVVTATNVKGSASASAATSPAVISVPVAPAFSANPSISGSATTGSTLTASDGTITGAPTPTVTRQWKSAGVAISGATATTYVVQNSDIGNTITVTVTASNTAGTANATSAATATVTPVASAPTNTVAPSISGTAATGSTLTAANGTWAGYPAPTYAYQWERAGTNISGATNATYTCVTADQGSAITVAVTATNGSGSATATSAGTAAVTGAPANTVAPTISGTANVGSLLTATTGTWTGSPTPTYTYQWYWFDTVAPISGATSSTYTPVSGDVGHTLAVNVTATNASGAVSASSAATAAVTAVATMPTGALGIWYMDQYSATPTPSVPNAITANAIQGNIFRAPRRLFNNTEFWNKTGITITDANATAPDGSSDASTLVCTGNWFLKTIFTGSIAAGTYTIAVNAKSSDGSQFAFSPDNTGTRSSVKTTTSSWQRFAYTFVKGSAFGLNNLLLCSKDGSTGANLQICSLDLYAGSSDLGPSSADGNLYLGLAGNDTTPSYASGEVNGATGGVGVIQFGSAQTLNTFTTQHVIVKTGSGGSGYSASLSKIQSYGQFAAFTDIGGVPRSVTGANYNFVGTGSLEAQSAGLWALLSNGRHLITHRYNGTAEELFLDDARIFVNVGALSAISLADLFFNAVNNASLYGGVKYHGIALWNRALSNAEIVTSYNVWKARAAVSSLTMNGDTTLRVYCAEGDSITNAYPYSYPYQASFSPAIIGTNFAVSGSGISTMVTRASFVDAVLPASLNGRKFILSVLIGANDLSTGYSGPGGTGTAGWLADLQLYCDNRRAAGWKVVVGTVLPRTAAGFNTARNVVNPTIRTWVGTHCDAVMDFASDATMGIDGNGTTTGPWNTTYYADGLHPTSAGMALMAPYLASAVNGL